MKQLRAWFLVVAAFSLGCGSDSEPAATATDVVVAVDTAPDDVAPVDDAQTGPGADDVALADDTNDAAVARVDTHESVDTPESMDADEPVDGTEPGDVTPLDDAGTPDDTGTSDDLAAPEDVGAPVDVPLTIDVPPDGPVTVTLAIGGPDDAVTSYLIDGPSGSWNLLGGGSVPLGRHWDVGHVSYHAALRFPDAAIPAGAVVESATLTLFPTNELDSNNPLWLNVWAEAAADAAPLSLTDYDAGRPDQRVHTTAGIDHWLIRCNAGCTDLSEYDCEQRKRDCWNRDVAFACPKDLTPLVQEVVSGAGWAAGHAITLLLSNAATDQDGAKYEKYRTVTGDDPDRGPAFRPTLTVRYHLPQ